MNELTYSVPGVSCGHCRAAISEEVEQLAGVREVEVDLDLTHAGELFDLLRDGGAAVAAADPRYGVGELVHGRLLIRSGGIWCNRSIPPTGIATLAPWRHTESTATAVTARRSSTACAAPRDRCAASSGWPRRTATASTSSPRSRRSRRRSTRSLWACSTTTPATASSAATPTAAPT